MAEENKHPPTTEEQAPPEMPRKAPKMEQAEIPDVGGGPAPSAKVIDLSAMRSTPEKDAPPDIPKETEAPSVSVTEYSKREWGKPMPEPEKPKPKRGRPAKAEKSCAHRAGGQERGKSGKAPPWPSAQNGKDSPGADQAAQGWQDPCGPRGKGSAPGPGSAAYTPRHYPRRKRGNRLS